MHPMANTLAIHWPATTFGTWLPGDPRGSWRGGQLIGPDPFLESECHATLHADAVMLDATERQILADEVGRRVREHGYRVYAATVQMTHIHLVFAPLPEHIDTVIARLKRGTALEVLAHRRKTQDAARVPRTLWTRGKYPIFIFDDGHLHNAIKYVRAHNVRIGLPADPYDWIAPPNIVAASCRE